MTGQIMSAPVVCLPFLGDQPQHVSRVVFRIAGYACRRLPGLERLTSDR